MTKSTGTAESGTTTTPEPEQTHSFLDMMNAAKTADEGRAIIAEYETALHEIEKACNMKPNVGKLSPKNIVGFASITAKEWEKYLKEAKKAGCTEDQIRAVRDSVSEGRAIQCRFKDLLNAEIKSTVGTEKAAKGKGDKLIDEQAPVVIRKTTQELPCKFKPAEKESFQAELLEKLQSKSDLENQKASSASMYGAKIKEASARIDVLSAKLRTGSEHRTVNVEWHLNFPVPGKKTCFRMDTKEIIEEQDMLPSDRQLVLDDVRANGGKTKRNLDEKEITEADPANEDPEGENDQGEVGDTDDSIEL